MLGRGTPLSRLASRLRRHPRPRSAALAAPLVLGALMSLPQAGQAQGTPPAQAAFSVTALATAPNGDVFNVVTNQDLTSTFLLRRDGVTGQVYEKFGSAPFSDEMTVGPRGRVYVGSRDGSVSVFARQQTGYRKVARWPLAPPVPGARLFPNGLLATAQGYTLVAAGAPGLARPPVFDGVLALDRRGRTVAAWPSPSEMLPTNAFVSSAGVAQGSGGQIYVNAFPCLAGICGPPAGPDGWIYELSLTRSGGSLAISTAARWASPELVSVGDIAALRGQDLIAQNGAGSVSELSLSGNRVSAVASLPVSGSAIGISTPNVRSSASTYVLADTNPRTGAAAIERFGKTVSGWSALGRPWPASWGSSGPPIPTCAGVPATITGTGGDDMLRGTPARDVITSFAGDDRVQGGGGNDLICTGSGSDQAVGGPGADRILAGPGSDRSSGGPGDDVLVGGAGADVARGGSGRDACGAERRVGC